MHVRLGCEMLQALGVNHAKGFVISSSLNSIPSILRYSKCSPHLLLCDQYRTACLGRINDLLRLQSRGAHDRKIQNTASGTRVAVSGSRQRGLMLDIDIY